MFVLFEDRRPFFELVTPISEEITSLKTPHQKNPLIYFKISLREIGKID